MVRFASLFDAKDRTVTFLSGKKYSVDDLRSMGAGDLLNSMFEFSEKLNALNLSDEEMSLFTAVVLVSAGKKVNPYHVIKYSCISPDLKSAPLSSFQNKRNLANGLGSIVYFYK